MHIASMKEATKDEKIKSLKAPDLLLIPLLENFGESPRPTVKVGDQVKKYQVIAQSDDDSAKIHSPVSGKITKIKNMIQIDGSKVNTIFIDNDHNETEIEEPLQSTSNTPEALLKIIKDAGIVGLGGAQFPTAKKFDIKDKTVDTFILNGVECEPYLTGDYALMKQKTKEFFEGIAIVDQILKAKQIVIAIEHANDELKDVFYPYLKSKDYQKIRVEIVPDEYPQGGELQLARTVTGIEIPDGTVPLEKGIVISNVGTIYAVYQAVKNGKPLIERVLTVSGEKVKNPGNYLVKVGTQVHHLFDACKVDSDDSIYVAGGPMMSPHVSSLFAPIHKGTLGLLVLPKENIIRLNCIWCGYCVDVCPMMLMPMKYDQFYKSGKYHKLNDYNISDCIECGACEYICPSNVPLIESIKKGKEESKKLKEEEDNG